MGTNVFHAPYSAGLFMYTKVYFAKNELTSFLGQSVSHEASSPYFASEILNGFHQKLAGNVLFWPLSLE